MSAIVIAVFLLALTYVWTIRGFFSAFLHLLCTVVAGAIALAAWEPLSYQLLELAPARGATWLGDMAWAFGLALPFAVSLAILRFATDAIVRANVVCAPAVNYAGGAVCGLGSAVIACGMLSMSIGFLRVGTEKWHSAVEYTQNAAGRGSLVYKTGLAGKGGALYTDVLTAKFYGFISDNALRPLSGESLAKWYPAGVHHASSVMRITFEGGARNTIKRSDIRIDGTWYTLPDPSEATTLGTFMEADSFSQGPHRALRLDGSPIDQGYLAGFEVTFLAGAREAGGSAQVIIGNSQVWLVVENTSERDDVADGETMTLHPVAMYSQAEASSKEIGRWRFDVPDLFIASVGGATEAPMTFEFAVPAGYEPLALHVKNVRYTVGDGPEDAYRWVRDEQGRRKPPQVFRAQRERDVWLAKRIGANDPNAALAASRDTSTRRPVISTRFQNVPRGQMTLSQVGISISAALGFTVQDGAQGGLKVERDSRDLPEIVDGEAKLDRNRIQGNIGVPNNLRISRFRVTQDIEIVQVDISYNSYLGAAVSDAPVDSPPTLIDTQGQRFGAVGFVYEDDSLYHVRFTPSQPLRGLGLDGVPSISPSKPTAKMKLLFRVNRGVSISQFQIGTKMVADFSQTPIEIPNR